MSVAMRHLPKEIVEQIAKTPTDGSNMAVARQFLAWGRKHQQEARRIREQNVKTPIFVAVVRLPTPTGKDTSNALEIVLEVVGFDFEKAMRGAPYFPFVVYAAQTILPLGGAVVRGWTLDEYEHQINVGVTYEALEQHTYAMPGNGQPDKPKGKSK